MSKGSRKPADVKTRAISAFLSVSMVAGMFGSGIPMAFGAGSAAGKPNFTLTKIESNATEIKVKVEPATTTDLTAADFVLSEAVKDAKTGHAEAGAAIKINAVEAAEIKDGGNVIATEYTLTTETRASNGTQLLTLDGEKYDVNELVYTAHNVIPLPVEYKGTTGTYTLSEKTAIIVPKNEAAKKVGQQLADVLNASTGYHIQVAASAPAGSEKNIILTLIGENATLATVDGVNLTKAELNKAARNDPKGIIETVAEEAYTLDVTADSITITAFDAEGLYRGISSLRQMFPAEIESKEIVNNVDWSVSGANIVDYPRYGFRDQQLDISRHFHDVDWIKKQIDTVSMYKLNYIKLHLTEQQSFRIAIEGYPELTDFGGMTKNGGNGTPGSMSAGKTGYYTQDDIREIVAYAAERYVEIIPEIEFPGHADSMLTSLPDLLATPSGGAVKTNTGGYTAYGATRNQFINDPYNNPFTAAYIDAVLEQVAELFPCRYLHMGGDEVYTMYAHDYVNVSSYVLNKINDLGKLSLQWVQDNAHVRDYTTRVDENGVARDVNPDIIQNWKDSYDSWQYMLPSVRKGSYILANLSDHTYLDHATYKTMPTSAGWAKGSGSFYGMQAGITTPYSYSWDPIQASRPYDSSKQNAAVALDAWTDVGMDDRIIGVEACMWTESIGSESDYEILLYPRVIGLAEIGWSPKNTDRIINPDTNPPSTQADTEKLYWVNYRERLAAQGLRLDLHDIDFMNDPDVWTTKEIVRPEGDYGTKNVTTTMNTPVSGKFAFAAADENDVAVMSLAAEPAQGAMTINPATGDWTYTPNDGFIGTDGFTLAFSTKGYGIPFGMSDGTSNNRSGNYLGFAFVTVKVERAANDTADHPVMVTLMKASNRSFSISLNPAVPGLKKDHMHVSIVVDGETVEIPVTNGGTYDNGSTYLMVSEPRAENTNYVLTIETDGYTFNPIILRNNEAHKAYLLSFDANYDSTEYVGGHYGSTGCTGYLPAEPAYYTEGVRPGLGQVSALPGNFGGLQAAGYTFVGWNTQADGKGQAYTADGANGSIKFSDFVMPGHDLTLYAMWEKKAASLNRVVYNANGAVGGDVPVDPYSPYVAGTGAVVVGNLWNLQKPGYQFDGWNTQADGLGTNYQPGSKVPVTEGGITLYADWAPAYTQYTTNPWVTVAYAANYPANATHRGEPPMDANSYAGNDFFLWGSRAVVKDSNTMVVEGYDFVGWNTKADGTGTSFAAGSEIPASAIALTQNYHNNGLTKGLTLYAQWKANGKTTPVSEKDLGVYFFNSPSVEALPWDRITTINYAFWRVDPETYKAVPGLGRDAQWFPQFEKMCAQYPDVHVVISVGGWADSGPFSDMAATPERRAAFIASCIQAMKDHPWLAGIDLDWEYPGIARDPYDMDGGCNVLGPGEDCANYLLLLQEMRAAFEAEWPDEHKILSVCAAGNIKDLDVQDLVGISKEVDRINIMTYDLHGGYWDQYAFHHSNVNAVAADGYRSSVTNVIEYFFHAGVDPQKINIGSPFYSKNWTLVDPVEDPKDALGAPAKNGGRGTYNPDDPNWFEYYDEAAEEAYQYNKETGVFKSIENQRSLQAKIDYINEKNLGGIIVWSASGDKANEDWPLLTQISTGFGLTGETVAITFNSNGGSAVKTVRVSKGGVPVQPEDPTREGYSFGGWYADEALTVAFDFSAPLNESVTLYAKWNSTGNPSPTAPSKPATSTETRENPDGSVTTIVTDHRTGAVTETTVYPEGNQTEKVTDSDKNVTITVTDKDGEVLAKVSIPAKVSAPATRFVDVPVGHWADESIHRLAGMGLVNGVGGNIFNMNGSMTRGDLATILFRMANGKAGIGCSFTDVAAGAYYADAVAWAAKVGVVTGYSDTRFGPKDTITREQLAAMLCRMAERLGIDTSVDHSVLNAFTDKDSVHSWAADAMAWCVSAGVIQGTSDEVLSPGNLATRAQVAVMLDRFIGLMK